MADIETIRLVVECIEEHVTEKLDLCTIASEIHVSPFHLHRSFSKALGRTLHDYLRRRQLTEAARLLVFSELPIVEIALSAGYESQQSFTRMFTAMYKTSPNVFRHNKVFYPLQLRLDLHGDVGISGGSDRAGSQIVSYATEEDIPAWMDLVRLVIDGYPFLDETEHAQVVRLAIGDGRALIAKESGTAAGIMLFSPASGHVDFLGVHPLFRNQGIAQSLLGKIVGELPRNVSEISITTYREGDKADAGYRKAIRTLGFTESEFLVEFGYPTQKFILGTDSLRKSH